MKEKEFNTTIHVNTKKDQVNITQKEKINKIDMIDKKDIIKTKEKVDFLRKENDNLIISYGAEVYKYAKHLEESFVCPNMFKSHKMDEKIRTKMIDWMIEVLHAYKCDNQTLFIAASILDVFIQKSTVTLENSNMHLIGVTCIYIASKYEDVIPIRMNSIHNKIAHKIFKEY